MSTKEENRASDDPSVGDVKCRTPINVLASAPGGILEQLGSGRGGRVGGDIERLERKKKTRRRKAKRKNPYNKQTVEGRGKKSLRLLGGKNGYEQPVAPYNSNQFLIEDHNDLQDFDVKLLAVAQANRTEVGSVAGVRTGRVRDASFTSAESDEDFFYSSPEDEEEFLTKEFSNTYQDLHAEELASMSKAELIQHVLHLEEKLDLLEKQLTELTKSDTDSNASGPNVELSVEDRMLGFQKEISKLVHVNEELKNENLKLRQQNGCAATSSEDSESDSSSSSESSDVSDVESANPPAAQSDQQNPYSHMNGHACPGMDSGQMETDNVT